MRDSDAERAESGGTNDGMFLAFGSLSQRITNLRRRTEASVLPAIRFRDNTAARTSKSWSHAVPVPCNATVAATLGMLSGPLVAGQARPGFFWESIFIDQNNPKRQTAGPQMGLTETGPNH